MNLYENVEPGNVCIQWQGMKDGMQSTTQESTVASGEETTLEEYSEIEVEQEETAKGVETALEESESTKEQDIEKISL